MVDILVELLEFVLLVFLFFVDFVLGNAAAHYTIKTESPDLYAEWKRRREERKVDK